ncbi:MAG TPA: hypothetical protein VHK88_16205 [Aquihabitans sp.]|nr:hypothetical protein [Aquihabitans sp.]
MHVLAEHGVVVLTLSHARQGVRARSGPAGRSSEGGAIIIFVLAFMVMILVVVLALFGMAKTQTASTRNYRQERALRYAADGALDAAIQWVKVTPTLGTASGSGCDMKYDVAHDDAGGTVSAPMASGSFLEVSCTATPGTTGSGAVANGEQAARDVTFTVYCSKNAAPGPRDPLACKNNAGISAPRVVGQARVRYDVDYGWPTKSEWARVPKILTFTVTEVG